MSRSASVAGSEVGEASVRRRPRDRRHQILVNAAELFAHAGYYAVRMEDIAEASGVTSRAIYRHFANKKNLLSHVVCEDQDRLLAMLDDPGLPGGKRSSGAAASDGAIGVGAAVVADTAVTVLDALVLRLAGASMDSLRLGALWQREARHLGSDDFSRVREGTRQIGGALRDAIGDAYPEQRGFRADVRGWMAVSILTSPGHGDAPPRSRKRLVSLLHAATLAAIATPDSAVERARQEGVAAVPTGAGRPRTARREQLIAAAAREFRERGFGGVGLDGFGIAGPAVYRYFDGKADILAAVITRSHEFQALECARALRDAESDARVIHGLVCGYVRVAVEFTDLLAVSVTEPLNLFGSEAERDRRIRQDDLAEWVRWLQVAREGLSEPDALALVTAVRTLINDLVRIPHLLAGEDFVAEVIACSLFVLLRTEVP